MKPKLLGRMGRLAGLAVAVACVVLALGAPTASATSVECSAITGSGSSLQNIAQKTVFKLQWTMLFNLMEQGGLLCSKMAEVTYEPTSSGKGKGEWGAKGGVLVPGESFNKEKLDEFVGTDVAPEGPSTTLTSEIGLIDDAGAKGSTKNLVVAVPIAQSAISVIVTLPEGCTPSATTTATVKNMPLAEEWNTKNSLFTLLFENVTLTGASCKAKPLLQAREVGSGTTAGFKRYLDDLEESTYDSCTLTAANSQSASCWPGVKPDEAGNETGGELAEKVALLPGSIGYADLADAIKKGFGTPGHFTEEHRTNSNNELILTWLVIAEVNNKGAELTKPGEEGGEAVSPEGAEGAANCEKAKYNEPTEVKPNVDWSTAKQSNATKGEAGVYPICTLTFDLAWGHYNLVEWENPVAKKAEKYTAGLYHTAFTYLRALVTEGQEGTALTELKKEHFFGLPAKVQTEAQTGVNTTNILF